MASKVDLANRALVTLGDIRLTSLTDANETARKVNNIFDNLRDELLSMYKWNFATARKNLGLDTSAPLFDYDNQFSLPSDFIRLIQINDQEIEKIPHAIEGSKLLTDEDEAKIIYIAKIEDTGKWPPHFQMAFCAYLQAELAYSITNSNTQTTNSYDLFRAKLKTAMAIDAQSGGEPRAIRQSNILRVRGKTDYDGLSTGTH